MYKTKISTSISAKKWNTELLKSDYSTYFQTVEYIQMNDDENFPIFIYVIDQDNKIVGQLGIRIIKTSITYSSPLFRKFLKLISNLTTRGVWVYGPIIHNQDKNKRLQILQTILEANNEIMEKYGLVFLEGFSPPLDKLIDEKYLKIFNDYGYNITKFVTYITDLNKSIDDVWSKVQKYTKTNVKRSIKRGITTKEIETFEEMKQFVNLHQTWAKTKGLKITNFEDEVKGLWDKHTLGIEKFFLAFKENELISGISLSGFNKIMIPTQVLNTYSKLTSLGGPALTWQAITWAKKTNMKVYDITGGPLWTENESDPDNTLPLTHYKRKWGGGTSNSLSCSNFWKKYKIQIISKNVSCFKNLS